MRARGVASPPREPARPRAAWRWLVPGLLAVVGTAICLRSIEQRYEAHTLAAYAIYVVNADGSGLRNLTREWGLDGLPIWSPDGTKLVFAKDQEESFPGAATPVVPRSGRSMPTEPGRRD